jgi:hypothetical protein
MRGESVVEVTTLVDLSEQLPNLREEVRRLVDARSLA